MTYSLGNIIRIKTNVVITLPLFQTLISRASASSPPKPVDCMPGVCGSSASSVHSARKRAHTARNALTEPFSCTSVIVHPPPAQPPPPTPPPAPLLLPLLPRPAPPLPPPPALKSMRKRTAFCTTWPVLGSYASSMRARRAPSGCGSGRSTGARRRRASSRVGAMASRDCSARE